MHKRNPYRQPPDFTQLAQAYPPLKSCVIKQGANVSIDFKNEVSQRRLTEALLHRDFGLSLELPPNRLCPPVPNRLNYVLWVEDIVQAHEHGQVCGLDIGTGASVIYPLLACKTNADWCFIATDIDALSLSVARQNITANNMQDRIRLVESTLEGPIFGPLLHDPTLTITFTMCNPPFYSSHADVQVSAAAKEFEPYAVCTGADVEMITAGGESAFVRKMVEESIHIGTRCRWYTSMLGKLSSLSQVVEALRLHSIDNYAITEFVQGTTRRWAIAWSLGPLRLPDPLARISSHQVHALIPSRNTLYQPFTGIQEAERVKWNHVLHAELVRVDGTTVSVYGDGACLVSAAKNTWSRSARRKQKQSDDTEMTDVDPELRCTVRWLFEEMGTRLEHQWVEGRDRQLFESFAGHVNRKVVEAIRLGSH
ncbi:S-adenosyl-L-methionine-dependent methyltransferase [Mycena indigotica]|uniref:S-adenosyl-L-methionine-dependent methyltransferase n=1 Tax=Mycena indigotica TaxID=2126181 RepID=A0A8H6WFU5_9AGAR|nr:S-adenosyl-L-methionine-dependent methyltransferase [Mycena indigotica]KAF7316127.1 S-adenosyl-L-methionine-dependent methyltransferase [Mycena indigotica]